MNRTLKAALFLALFVLAISAQADIRYYGGGGSSTPEAWTSLFTTSDVNRINNQVSTADGTLTFAVLANKTYVFEAYLNFSTAAATPGVKTTIQCPSSPTRVAISKCWSGDNTSAACFNEDLSCAVDLADGGGTQRGSLSYLYRGVIANGANAGNIAVAWAQNTSNGSNTTLRAGSYLKYRQVN